MHDMTLFDWTWVAMMVACFAIRTPLELRNKKIRSAESRESALSRFLLLLVFTGSTTLPLLYFFTPWMDFAGYRVGMAGWAGVVLAVVGTILFWLTHRGLGRQFSPMLEVKEAHALVTTGIYQRVRHPMYTAIFTIAMAQCCLIGNLVVGPAFLAAFALLYVTRIDNEEKMMLDHFGSAYADYRERTNRLLPSLRG